MGGWVGGCVGRPVTRSVDGAKRKNFLPGDVDADVFSTWWPESACALPHWLKPPDALFPCSSPGAFADPQRRANFLAYDALDCVQLPAQDALSPERMRARIAAHEKDVCVLQPVLDYRRAPRVSASKSPRVCSLPRRWTRGAGGGPLVRARRPENPHQGAESFSSWGSIAALGSPHWFPQPP